MDSEHFEKIKNGTVKELIEDISGVSEVKWSIYNYSGKIFSNYYNSIEVITDNLLQNCFFLNTTHFVFVVRAVDWFTI